MVGTKIRDLRKKIGLTQEQLADHELTKSYVSQVELGRIQPSRKALQIIAHRLGKPLGYFLDNDDDMRTVDVLIRASGALWSSGRLDEATAGLIEAQHLAKRIGRDDVLSRIESLLGQLEFGRGHFLEAQAHLIQALTGLTFEEAPVDLVKTETSLAETYAALGLFHEAARWHAESTENARRMADRSVTAAHAFKAFGDFSAKHQAWQSAVVLYQEAQSHCPEADLLPSLELDAALLLAFIHLGARDDHQARLERLLPRLQQCPPNDGTAALYLQLAQAALALQQYHIAITLLSDARPLVRRPALEETMIRVGLQVGYQSHNRELAMSYADDARRQASASVRADALWVLSAFETDPIKALELLSQARRLAPENSHISACYALASVRAGAPDASALQNALTPHIVS